MGVTFYWNSPHQSTGLPHTPPRRIFPQLFAFGYAGEISSQMIHVIKADGRIVPFDPSKIEATCIRAGAFPSLARTITNSISGKL